LPNDDALDALAEQYEEEAERYEEEQYGEEDDHELEQY
jgi:hypothetical protein